MTYVEGFLLAVPVANRDAYRAHAEKGWPLFEEFGATRMVESWGDDVPRGETNDLWSAVEAEEGEAVVFSWFEYPDRATRDRATERMMSDPRMEEMGRDMPFDGARMIWSGFSVVRDIGPGGTPGYIDGVLLAVPTARKEEYLRFSATTDPIFVEHGALRVIDTWGNDVRPGKRTDFLRATQAGDDETVVFGWMEWPSKDVRDAGWEKLRTDPRMAGLEMPFDGKRMMFGGFVPILDHKGS
jgi:uncharacterized protein YbaA (DUF1428 family)